MTRRHPRRANQGAPLNPRCAQPQDQVSSRKMDAKHARPKKVAEHFEDTALNQEEHGIHPNPKSIPRSLPTTNKRMTEERKIGQTQFNSMVLETMSDLEMDEKEAIEFTLMGLEAQKVTTSNLLAEVEVVKEEDPVSVFRKTYSNLENTPTLPEGSMEDFLTKMTCAVDFSNKSLTHKLYSGSAGVHKIILAAAKLEQALNGLESILHCLLRLITGYPDLIDEPTMDFLIEKYKGVQFDGRRAEMKSTILKLLLESITRHEKNKQLLFSKNIVDLVESAVNDPNVASTGLDIVVNLCADDDIREEISNAHTRAVSFAEKYLVEFYNRLKSSEDKEQIAGLWMSATAMCVTSQLAYQLYQNDMEFTTVMAALNEYRSDRGIATRIMKFLRAISGNDDAQSAMRPLIPFIVSVINENVGCAPLIQSAFLLIASLSLRNQKNSCLLIENNAVDILVQGMKVHAEVKVRRNGCMALRNMAASSKHVKQFEDAGVADFITEIMSETQGIKDEAKGVLIAIGAPVQLEERWTGKKGDIVRANIEAS